MDDSHERGVDRLLALVQPRWDRDRHERVFAEILDRIRCDERQGGKRMLLPRGRRPLRLDHQHP
jgi:hypothetical protein